MRIGIDLDDTIFKTTEKLRECQGSYLKKNNIDATTLWNSRVHRSTFINENIHKIYDNLEVKDDALRVINLLKENGNEIVLLTARSKNFNKDFIEITANSLNKNSIYYDMLLFANDYKLQECIDHGINIMIDNSITNVEILKDGGINALLFDEHNEHKNIKKRVCSWKEIERLFIDSSDKLDKIYVMLDRKKWRQL